MNETHKLLSLQESLTNKLQVEEHMDPLLAQRIVKQLILQQAERGEILIQNQLKELKQVMSTREAYQPNDRTQSNNNLSTYALDKSLGEAMTMGMRAETLNKGINVVVKENEVKLAKQTEIYQVHQAMQKQDQQKDRGLEI